MIKTKSNIRVYYDGECRFCNHYAQYIELFKKYDIQLCNARDYLDEMKKHQQHGYDINQGMIVESEGVVYHGAEGIAYVNALILGKEKHTKPSFFFHKCYTVINWLRKGLLRIQKRTGILR